MKNNTKHNPANDIPYLNVRLVEFKNEVAAWTTENQIDIHNACVESPLCVNLSWYVLVCSVS